MSRIIVGHHARPLYRPQIIHKTGGLGLARNHAALSPLLCLPHSPGIREGESSPIASRIPSKAKEGFAVVQPRVFLSLRKSRKDILIVEQAQPGSESEIKPAALLNIKYRFGAVPLLGKGKKCLVHALHLVSSGRIITAEAVHALLRYGNARRLLIHSRYQIDRLLILYIAGGQKAALPLQPSRGIHTNDLAAVRLCPVRNRDKIGMVIPVLPSPVKNHGALLNSCKGTLRILRIYHVLEQIVSSVFIILQVFKPVKSAGDNHPLIENIIIHCSLFIPYMILHCRDNLIPALRAAQIASLYIAQHRNSDRFSVRPAKCLLISSQNILVNLFVSAVAS